MKIKKWLSAICLAAALSFALPAAASLLGQSPGLSTVLAEEEGWNQNENGWYYLRNGQRLTGLQSIGGAQYFFNENGYRITGTVKIGKYTYLFRPSNGKLCTGYAGLRKLNRGDDFYYLFLNSRKGRVATRQWVKSNGRYYYADASSKVNLGTIKVGRKLYHITTKGRMTSYGRSSYDKKYYYAGSNGVLKTGLQKINGKTYYFSPKTGARQTGTVKVGKNTYYFTSKGYAKSGWVRQNKKYYYYGTNGKKLTGLRTIKGKKYYLDPKKDGARTVSSWKKIGKHYYYFDSKGVMKTGFFNVNGKRYYANSQGIRRKGWQTVNGRKYYMDNKTAVMKTGWFNYKNKKYYLNPSKNASSYGAAMTGWVKIKGSWYYFNYDGTMKTGWLLDNMKYYYLDKKTGKMLTGKQKIDGKTYNFGSSGGFKAQLSGEWVIKVNRVMNCITVYRGDTPVKAIVCSTARDGVSTPKGTFRLLDKLRWHELIGPSWGQYCSHITSDILFHSVPCTRYRDNHSLNAAEFNKLGTAASAGCIRLTVADAKWLYDNCPVGTKVVIYDNRSTPGPLGKPSAPKIPLSQNYDPTDPNA